MNTSHVDAIAHAVLYEGYMLYPYRPSSVKNRQRFNFGVLYPRSYGELQTGSDTWSMQTECLIEGTSATKIEVRLRFLKLVTRSVRKLIRTPDERQDQPGSMVYDPVSSLEVDGKVFTSWQEAIECEVVVPVSWQEAIERMPVAWSFDFPVQEETELVRDAKGSVAGQIVRKQQSVRGVLEIDVTRATEGMVDDGIFKVQAQVKNLTPLECDTATGRDSALTQSLISAHLLLGAIGGQFVSLLEPPTHLSKLAADCNNVGVWPVLVGAEGERDTILASPIILYDYPQIAPESPGDLFDGTEIDEILALRILTMTDAEKTEMRNTDDRTRAMLERTETLPLEHLMKLHGTLRELRPSEFNPSREETP
jgi:hypothetical protein